MTKSHLAAVGQLKQLCTQWEQQLISEQRRIQLSVSNRMSAKEREKQLLEKKSESLQSLIDLSSNDAVEREAELKQQHADAKTIIEQTQTKIKHWNSCAVRPLADTTHSAAMILNQLNSSVLLTSLTAATKGKLQSWLTPLGKSLVSSQHSLTHSHCT